MYEKKNTQFPTKAIVKLREVNMWLKNSNCQCLE